MPNWCSNTLIITGDDEEIKKFEKKAKAKDTALSMNKFLPTPKALLEGTAPNRTENAKELIEKYGAKDWYDWHINNWGTKWDLTAELLCSDEGYLQYCFDSAWSPPIEFLKEVSKKYTRLEFRLRYDEPGVGFMGVAKYKNGEGEDKCLDY